MNQDNRFNPALVTVRGTFWTYLSYAAGKALVFLSTIILARLLLKEDFGIAAYGLIVISFLDVLSDLGIGLAVIYHNDNPKRCSTAFWLNLAVGLLLFFLTYLLSPLAGMFFKDPRAVDVTRVLALTFPIQALSNVHDALLRKEFSFGRKLVPDLARVISKGMSSIVFALLGFGAWSLVYGQLAGTMIGVIVYWWTLNWRPGFEFDTQFVRPLLSYGMGIVFVNGIGILLLNVDYLFVGRYLGVVALGVYTLSFRVPELLITQFCGVLGKVIFPVYAKMKEDEKILGQGFLTTMRYVTMITIPMGVGLALVAKPLVLTFFSHKWADAIPVIPAIAVYTVFRSLTFNIGDLYKAQGRLALLSKLGILQLLILTPALWWAVTRYESIVIVGWMQAIVAFIGATIKLSVAGKMLGKPLRSFLIAFQPAIFSSIVMGIGVISTLHLTRHSAPALQLISCVIAGVLSYGITLWWLRRDVVITAGNTLRAALLGSK